jgi:hypothetical protein
MRRVVRVCAIMTMNGSSRQTRIAGRRRAMSGEPPLAREKPSHFLRHLAQLEFLHLAGGGLGQFREHHVARAFVAGEILAAPGAL